MTTILQDNPAKPTGLCWECGYSLQSLPTPRCPECGRPFDPDDPATMNMDTDIGPFARWLMKPPGRPTFSLIALAVILSLWAAAIPGSAWSFLALRNIYDLLVDPAGWKSLASIDQPLIRYTWAMLAWMLVLSVWLPRRILRGITVLRVSNQRAATFAYWRRWLMPYFLLAGTIILCRTPVPVYAGFWISKPALHRLVEQQHRNPGAVGSITTVGIYPHPNIYAQALQKPPPGWVFITYGTGFRYSPDRTPRENEPDQFGATLSYRYLGGGWYAFEYYQP